MGSNKSARTSRLRRNSSDSTLGGVPLVEIRRIEWLDKRTLVLSYQKEEKMCFVNVNADPAALSWLSGQIISASPGVEIIELSDVMAFRSESTNS